MVPHSGDGSRFHDNKLLQAIGNHHLKFERFRDLVIMGLLPKKEVYKIQTCDLVKEADRGNMGVCT